MKPSYSRRYTMQGVKRDFSCSGFWSRRIGLGAPPREKLAKLSLRTKAGWPSFLASGVLQLGTISYILASQLCTPAYISLVGQASGQRGFVISAHIDNRERRKSLHVSHSHSTVP